MRRLRFTIATDDKESLLKIARREGKTLPELVVEMLERAILRRSAVGNPAGGPISEQQEREAEIMRTKTSVELTPENVRNLRWLERMTGVERASLVNEFILNDRLSCLRHPRSGELRDMIGMMIVYANRQEAAAAGRRLLKFEGDRISRRETLQVSYHASGQIMKRIIVPAIETVKVERRCKQRVTS